MKLVFSGILVLLISAAPSVQARQQASGQDDLAAAARQAREQRKAQASSGKVWTNDNIPTDPGGVSVVGPDSSADTTTANGGSADKSASPKTGTDAGKAKFAADQSDLAAAKDQLQTLQTDLDIMQRKLALDKQTYFGKPDYSTDPQGQTDLNGEQDQIDGKQSQISDVQKKIAELQSKSQGSGDASSSGGASSDSSSSSSTPNNTTTPASGSTANSSTTAPASQDTSK
jgi:hypothetical protein